MRFHWALAGAVATALTAGSAAWGQPIRVAVEAQDFQDGNAGREGAGAQAVAAHFETGVPVTIGVIPCGAGSTADGVTCTQSFFHQNYPAWLAQQPSLFEVAQHGLTHDPTELYNAFTQEVQEARINQGAARLESWGLPRPRTFMVPFSAGNTSTLRALENTGFNSYEQNAGLCTGQDTTLELFCDSVSICERGPGNARVTGGACVIRTPEAVISEINTKAMTFDKVFVNYSLGDLFLADNVTLSTDKVNQLRALLTALAAQDTAGNFALSTMNQIATGQLPGGDPNISHVTGADFGGGPNVVVWSVQGSTVNVVSSFFAYNPAFGAGVRVAGSRTRPLVVTSPGRGGGPDIRIWNVAVPNGQVLAGRFLAYNPGFTGGVYVAMGQNAAGEDLLVTGAGESGGPHVRFFDLANPAAPGDIDAGGFFALEPTFTGGARVAACNLDAEAGDEIVVGAGPGAGAGAQVRVFKRGAGPAVTDFGSFNAFNPAFTGGVYVACGDVDDDGVVELVVSAGAGGGPQVRLFERLGNGTFQADGAFLAYAPNFTGGVRVGVADTAHDGHLNVVVSPGPGGGPQVRTFRIPSDGAAPVENPAPYFAYDPNFTAGLFISGVSASAP